MKETRMDIERSGRWVMAMAVIGAAAAGAAAAVLWLIWTAPFGI
jgi:hypothetical protein